MNREQYHGAVMELYKKPPMKETPNGQKFNIGDRVKIIEGFWGDEIIEGVPKEGGFTKSGFLIPPREHEKGKEAVIEYSYYQKYGNHDRKPSPNNPNLKQYCIKFDDGNCSSWWDEHNLVLITPPPQ